VENPATAGEPPNYIDPPALALLKVDSCRVLKSSE
jgi:hypothetical protein